MFFYSKKQKTSSLSFLSYCKKIGKTENINEDAYFLTPTIIGIADGVGGVFHEFGISSEDFSKELMKNCKEVISEYKSQIICRDIVVRALSKMKNGGSSTYLLASLKKNKLNISNLGDCGLLLFRKSNNSIKLVFQTSAKQYSFNTPYSLCKEFSSSQLKKVNGTKIKDFTNKLNPFDSDEYCITVHEGDIVVVATDGLLDNVFPEDIRKLLKKCIKHRSLSEITNKLIDLAFNKSIGKKLTPFEENMKRAHQNWVGGKKDDITVIVSILQAKVCSN